MSSQQRSPHGNPQGSAGTSEQMRSMDTEVYLDNDFDNIAGITARKDQQKCQHNDGHLMQKTCENQQDLRVLSD